MLNVTPPAGAGADRLTVKLAVTVLPAAPSVTLTSLIDRFGGGTEPAGVRLKSSMARPSSAPVALESFQRIQNVAPAGMDRLPTEPDTAVRLAAALPSSAPALAAVLIGLT